MTRESSWLNLGTLANMAKGSQEQPRKLQEQLPEYPGVARMSSWLDLSILGQHAKSGLANFAD